MTRVAAAMVAVIAMVCGARAQDSAALLDLARPKDYRLLRFSSYDRQGTNWDGQGLGPGDTRTVVDYTGAGIVSHVWFTFDGGPSHLKTLVLRAVWDVYALRCGHRGRPR